MTTDSETQVPYVDRPFDVTDDDWEKRPGVYEDEPPRVHGLGKARVFVNSELQPPL